MSGDAGSLPPLILQLSLGASALGAFVGGYMLMHPAGSRLMTGSAVDPADTGGTRALAGALLVGHASALAALAQNPAIGSCMAAGLGSAWFGAAAGRSIAAIVGRTRSPKIFLRVLFEAALGVLLWGPLWYYLRLLHHHGALGGET